MAFGRRKKRERKRKKKGVADRLVPRGNGKERGEAQDGPSMGENGKWAKGIWPKTLNPNFDDLTIS